MIPINFIEQDQIDRLKWNSCVHYAGNGNVFGYKWFLDFVAKDWDALIEGDYESVFPLTWRTHQGQKELFQPALMRELGLFSINVLSQKRINTFFDYIQKNFQKVDIILNEAHSIPLGAPFKTRPLQNYQLILNRDYEALSDDYASTLQGKLEQVKGLTLNSSIKPEQIADFFKTHTKSNAENEKKYHALLRIMYNALHRGIGSASGVLDERGKLLAANFFLYSHGKALSLVPVTSPTGEKRGALPFLFDIFIRGNAGKPLILDFNSDSSWYQSFGAKENYFYRVTLD